ncbi:S8 family peptidase [Micromonospora fluostatini]|uniref:S8 family peptidase n=1 Tax=Micromonospora sp. JCM 30529 TaxID=3421643 RepID=UPI003D176245
MRLAQSRLRRIGAFAVACTVVVVAASGPASAGAAPAEGTPAIRNAGGTTAIADSFLVVLRDDTADRTDVARTAERLTGRYGGTVGHHYSAAVRGFSIRTSAAVARKLAADPAVAFVEQDHVVRLDGTQTSPPWGLDRIDQADLPLDASYTYPTNAGAGVHAYVVDTGIRLTHQDFGGRAVSGVDLVDGGTADDCQGHGTHVAGTVGGTTFGVAKQTTLVAVRVFDCIGAGALSLVVAAVDWITANAVQPAVVVMSLGYFVADSDPSGTLQSAITTSIGTGISYAVSAGNNNDDACVKTPALIPAVITVAASQADDGTWPSTNEGSCVDLFAPGLNVLSAGHQSDTQQVYRSGTSMAAPHVAGAAALVLAAHPTWTPAQVATRIVGTATPNTLNWVTPGTVNLLLHVGPALVS